jgi:gas vesicle protein
MLSKGKAWAAALLVGVFVAGAAIGAAVTTLMAPQDQVVASRTDARADSDRGRRRGYAERLQDDLNLSPEQRASVDAILAEREAEMRELWEDMRPRFDALRESIRIEIMELLDESQQEKYQALIERARHRGDRERGSKDQKQK